MGVKSEPAKGNSVSVTSGVYKGMSGTIVHATPRKVRVQLDNGTETGLIAKTNVSVAAAAGRSESPARAPKLSSPVSSPEPTRRRGRAGRGSAGSPKTPPAYALSAQSSPRGSSRAERQHSEAITEAFEEPIMLVDPSILLGLGLVLLDLMKNDMTLSPATIAAVALFFAARVFSAPPRAPMGDMDWMTVNWFLVVGVVTLWEAASFAKGVDIEAFQTSGGWAGMQVVAAQAAFKDVAICAAVGGTSLYTYVCGIQARKSREVMKVTACSAVLGRLACIVSGRTRSVLVVALFKMVAENFDEPSNQNAVIGGLTLICFWISVTITVSAWAEIVLRF